MAKEISVKIVLRHNTTAEWEKNKDVILQKGEIGFEFISNDQPPKIKIGNGRYSWEKLPYFTPNLPNSYTWGALRGTTLQNTVTETENLHLKKPGYGDIASIRALNDNFDLLDLSYKTVSGIIESLKLQVDKLIASTTPGQSYDLNELTDIRIRANGVEYESAGAAVRAIDEELQELTNDLSSLKGSVIPDGLQYSNNYLQLTSNGEPIGDPVEVIGGSGGGGGGSTSYVITLTNLLSSRIISVAEGMPVVLRYSYKSIDNENYADGNGVGALTINNIQVSSFVVPQGENSIDITSFLKSGENNVKLKVTNSEGAYKTLSYTVSVLALSVTSTTSLMATYNVDSTNIQYTVNGGGTKIAHFILDGIEVKKETITSTGQSRQYNMERLPDGAHTFEIYATSENDGTEIKSNVLTFGMIWHSSTTSEPIILIKNAVETATQGDTIIIPYMVFHPHYEKVSITREIIENNKVYKADTLIVDRVSKEWTTQDFPAGQVTFKITCENVSAQTRIQVSPSTFSREVYTDNLELQFTAEGRSNNEENPAVWTYGNNISATFTNIGWSNIDGWLTDSAGQSILRLLPGSKMEIPFKPFAKELSTSGYTIEIELATQNVSDYDSVVLASFNERGLEVKSQSAKLQSESTMLSAQFKEDDRVRLTFVIEQNSTDSSGQSTSNRLVYIYINGICCGVQQYSTNDQFRQSNPVNLIIGAETCGIDIYVIRFYDVAFTSEMTLNNFICDRSSLKEKIEVDQRNDIIDPDATDIQKKVTISSLKGSIPYIVMQCPELPQYKGDKKKNVSMYYVNPAKPEKNFSAQGCQFNVQGTSSAGYPVKNFKISMKKGITYEQSGETAKGYQFTENSLLSTTLCLKADYASSEHVNNAVLVQFYEETNPWKDPPQRVDERVRQGVYGEPIVVFWENTQTNEIKYWGMYNMLDDKSNENVFGFVDIDVSSIIPEEQQRIECWEWLNNNTGICLFTSDKEFNETKVNSSGVSYPAWQDSIEPRFPDLDEMYSQTDAIQRAISWVVSTDARQATNSALAEPAVYQTLDTVYNSAKTYYTDNTATTVATSTNWSVGCYEKFTADSADYRYAKFKAEFTNYFYLEPMTFYYIFTEVFLMIDNRAKNMFLTTFDGVHWFPLPYDFDTGIGINNEGSLVFDYNLEDYDQVNGADVFNGQTSTLWINFSKCFQTNIRSMYTQLRSANGAKEFSYQAISSKMDKHQDAWCENLWNLDNEIKYLQPFFAGSNNLAMAQGDKKTQRDFWLYNGFKYRDSKYEAGEAVTNYIHVRVNAPGEIRITPYSHIWARVEFGNAKDELKRATRNTEVVFDTTGIEKLNDLETHIYSSDRIAKLGDLSPLKISYCDLSRAPKLQQILIGSEAEGYTNEGFTNLQLGSSDLLQEIDVSNCINLTNSVDASNCPCLEIFKSFGTKLSSVSFSNGGRLRIVRLPETISSLILRNQTQIEELSIKSYANISSLWIENSPAVPFEEIVAQSTKLDRIRLYNVEWETTSEATLKAFYDKVSAKNSDGTYKVNGMDATGKTVGAPVVTGKVKVPSISEDFLRQLNLLFPELIVNVNGVEKYFINYIDCDSNIVYSYIANGGSTAIDPVAEGLIEQSSVKIPDATEDTRYAYNGWLNLPEKIDKSYTIRVNYQFTYRVQFLDYDGVVYENATQWIIKGQDAVDPYVNGMISRPEKPTDAQYNYTYLRWNESLTMISMPLNISPIFQSNDNYYTVQFWSVGKYDENGNSIPLKTQTVKYGDKASYDEVVDGKVYYYVNGEPSPYYEFLEWDSSLTITPQYYTADPIEIHAVFTFLGKIEDTWEQIIENAKSSTATRYGLGMVKELEMTIDGTLYTLEMELVALNFDILAQPDPNYRDGAEKATYTFLMKDLYPVKRVFNRSQKTYNGYTSYTAGGYGSSELKSWLEVTVYDLLPEVLRAEGAIKLVNKISDTGYLPNASGSGPDHENQSLRTTTEKLWIPSATELNLDKALTEMPTFLEYAGQSATGGNYPWFSTDDTRIKRNAEKVAQAYWTRSFSVFHGDSGNQYRMIDVRANGSYLQNSDRGQSVFTLDSVTFGFCI